MAEITDSKLLHIDTGILKKDACIVLVKTEWNAHITDQLEMGCIAELEKLGVKKTIVITVPGAFEIPFAIKQHWEETGKKETGGCVYCYWMCDQRRYPAFRLCMPGGNRWGAAVEPAFAGSQHFCRADSEQ